MTAHNGLRLLPWTTTDGNPCYLITDDHTSHLSRLADSTEAAQLAAGAELLDHAREVLADKKPSWEELRYTAADLAAALRDALRVAESRGHRLPLPAYSAHQEGGEGAGY
ncbi:hypothetical protein AB0F57_22375 [Streptomyces tanashiensis]|uniref:hypothetical protein n=1 Tax=Streptomyces tanashiensis TaxID=67367 RepID=UPI0033FFB3A3